MRGRCQTGFLNQSMRTESAHDSLCRQRPKSEIPDGGTALTSRLYGVDPLACDIGVVDPGQSADLRRDRHARIFEPLPQLSEPNDPSTFVEGDALNGQIDYRMIGIKADRLDVDHRRGTDPALPVDCVPSSATCIGFPCQSTNEGGPTGGEQGSQPVFWVKAGAIRGTAAQTHQDSSSAGNIAKGAC